MNSSTPTLTALCTATLLALVGCDKPPEPSGGDAGAAADAVTDTAADAVEVAAEAGSNAAVETGSRVEVEPATAAALPADTLGTDETLDALVDEDEIPYPVYPNGEKYRVGGENGLKIVLFETTDSFEEVDAYYGGRAGQSGMPRLAAMKDYVRYSRVEDDDDPWATHRPGIVIHRFGDDEARDAVGADASARTNIIMSY